jgi:hypothetical protein
MDFKEAQGSLTSFEQANIIGVADYLVCHLFGAGELRSTLGDGTDGAENSAFVRVSSSFERGQYLMALLGRYAHQEYVIIFSAEKNGQAVLWQLKAGPSAGIERLRSALDASGIKYRTIDSERASTTVYVFDADHTLHDGLLKAATAVGATMEGIRGEGQLLGSPNRDDAMKVFDRVVTDHERAHPEDTFSRQLWSQQLHDAKNRTCTSESGSE